MKRTGTAILSVILTFGYREFETMAVVVRDAEGELRATAFEDIADPDWIPGPGRHMEDERPVRDLLIREGDEIALTPQDEIDAHAAIDQAAAIFRDHLKETFARPFRLAA